MRENEYMYSMYFCIDKIKSRFLIILSLIFAFLIDCFEFIYNQSQGFLEGDQTILLKYSRIGKTFFIEVLVREK